MTSCRGAEVTYREPRRTCLKVHHYTFSFDAVSWRYLLTMPRWKWNHKKLPLCLTFRVNDYIKNGLDKDLVDPDKGIEFRKEKKKLRSRWWSRSRNPNWLPFQWIRVWYFGASKNIIHLEVYLIEDVEIRKKLHGHRKADLKRIQIL